MLELSLTRIRHSKDLPVTADTLVQEEGIPLVQVMQNGTETAAVSGYTGAKVFLGFSYSETMRPGTKAEVIEFTISSTNTDVTLRSAPITGQINVVNTADNTAFTSNASPATGKYQLDGAVVKFAAEDAGKKVKIQYRYVPSQQELKFNDRVPFTFNTAPEQYGRIGCILAGEVFTDQFDASINWEAPTTGHVLVAGDNGRVSMAASSSGVEIPAIIIQVPNVNCPYLGLRLN